MQTYLKTYATDQKKSSPVFPCDQRIEMLGKGRSARMKLPSPEILAVILVIKIEIGQDPDVIKKILLW